jgi:Kef-type K+ transport system membrane component KefB
MLNPHFAFFAIGSPKENILLAMFLVFATAKVLAEIFERLHQPGIVGEILAGVVLGPSVLNWVQPSDLLKTLAELGVVFLLFRVGLEVKSSELLRVGRTAVSVAALGVAIPLPVGWAIMGYFGVPGMQAIFVGTAMVATSVGITAQVLAAKGLLSHAASKTILAAAVIDDVLGLIVLAIVGSVAKNSINVGELALTAAVAIGFTLIAATWGTRAMTRFFPGLQRLFKAGQAQFNLAMVVLFGLTLLAMYAGVAAIIGAFLAGMTLSESLDRRVQDFSQGVSELLTPFFLAEIGLHLDVSVFANPETLLISLAILLAAIISKMIGCGVGAWTMGWRDAIRIGVGMTPRGEVGMVVAQLGLGLGVVQPQVYAVVVFMAVGTTVIAPALLNLTFRGARAENKLAFT